MLKTVDILKSKVKKLKSLNSKVTNNAVHEVLKLEFKISKLEKSGRIGIGSDGLTYISILSFSVFSSLYNILSLSLCSSLSLSLSLCFSLSLSIYLFS